MLYNNFNSATATTRADMAARALRDSGYSLAGADTIIAVPDDTTESGTTTLYIPQPLTRFVTDANTDRLKLAYKTLRPLPDFQYSAEKGASKKTRLDLGIAHIHLMSDRDCTVRAFAVAEEITQAREYNERMIITKQMADVEADKADREIMRRFELRYRHYLDGDYDTEYDRYEDALARLIARAEAIDDAIEQAKQTDEEREAELVSLACRASRYLKKHSRRRFELLALALRRTGETTGKAVSNYSSIRMTHARENTRTWEETHQIRTADDRVFKLSDIRDKKTKGEAARVYAWLKGLEKFARKKKHGSLVPCFITLTAPPEFHPNPGNGHDTWDYSTPTSGQEWLMLEWAKLRARLAKVDITLAGFRVSEPHADGCAHLHYLVYVSAKQRTAICKAISHRWRIVKNKNDHRTKDDKRPTACVKWLDDRSESEKRKASAASYVMKYVMKTLHAKPEEEDRERDWRQVWGIRSYQFFGVTTKNVWEALRHKDAKAEPWDKLTSQAIYYARNGDFCSLLEIDGEIGIKDKDRVFSIDIDDESDPDKKTIFICKRVDEAVFHVLEFFKYRATLESTDGNNNGNNEGKNKNQNRESYSYSKVTQEGQSQSQNQGIQRGFGIGWVVISDKTGISYRPPPDSRMQ